MIQPDPASPRITVEYGDGPYKVEFALTEDRALIGRYIHFPAPHGAGPWEPRPRIPSDPSAATVSSLIDLLRAYA